MFNQMKKVKTVDIVRRTLLGVVITSPAACMPNMFGAAPLSFAANINGPPERPLPPASDARPPTPPQGTQHSFTPLLNLIGHTEGTDRGDGYNETLGYGAFTNGDVYLTQLTLAQIDDLQTTMLAHPANRWNSSALGRYQIVRKTLRSLKKKLGLPDTVKFTPSLQDRLAIDLINGRGYVSWRNGHISDRKFALELSKEWASLPNPLTGGGYYSGQRAAVDYATVASVLAQIR